jgi:hypothetical protein
MLFAKDCSVPDVARRFFWGARQMAYRWVRYLEYEANRLELEFKSICWNLKRLTNLGMT